MAEKITIRGFIGWDDNATPEFLSRELSAAKGEDVEIEIASGGGFVFAGLEMANLVRNYEGRTIARVTGLSASMASYIPMMADEMIVEDNAVFMVHNVSMFAFGDFRDLAKAAKHIEGLRDVLAKAYVNKTGKSLADVQELMNDETFYYGDEIVEAGFADSVIQVSTDGDDKDTAVILAREEVASITAKMKENESALKEDWQKAAAYFDEKKPQSHKNNPPAGAGKPNKEEVQEMDLKALLAENPAAKAEYDIAIESARTEGETAGIKQGKDTMNEAFTAAIPILSSASYPDTVKERVTVKAQAGDVEGLKDFVAMHDMNVESNAAASATGEQGEETNGQHDDEDGQSPDGMVNNAGQLVGAVKQHQAQYGNGGTN
jgi:ATP-dependent protease ClpP protease subunit